MHWRRKWQPTPVFLPGESQGRGAWWAVVYGVAQSRTRLKQLSSSSRDDGTDGGSLWTSFWEFNDRKENNLMNLMWKPRLGERMQKNAVKAREIIQSRSFSDNILPILVGVQKCFGTCSCQNAWEELLALSLLRSMMQSICLLSHTQRPHGLYFARILCLWDFPGKNTGVGCHFLL